MKTWRTLFFTLITFILTVTLGFGQDYDKISLYDTVPNAKASSSYKEEIKKEAGRISWILKVTDPELWYYQSKKGGDAKPAVIIAPGGGYAGISMDNEGFEVAEQFDSLGVSAFILKYRLPSDKIMKDKTIGPLQDAQKAIQYVRENAPQYNVDPDKIGIIGFSAGGHLAASAATHFDEDFIQNPENTNLRPDFSILVYPVVTMGKYAHGGSKENLLGERPASDDIGFFSLEKQVTEDTPPIFMVQANNDSVVPVKNTLHYIEALDDKGIANEAHIYPTGGHGFGLHNDTVDDDWFKRLANWLKTQGILD